MRKEKCEVYQQHTNAPVVLGEMANFLLFLLQGAAEEKPGIGFGVLLKGEPVKIDVPIIFSISRKN